MRSCENLKCGKPVKVRRTTQRWHGGGTHRVFVCPHCRLKFDTVEVSRRNYDKRVAEEAQKLVEKIYGRPLPVPPDRRP